MLHGQERGGWDHVASPGGRLARSDGARPMASRKARLVVDGAISGLGAGWVGGCSTLVPGEDGSVTVALL